MYCESGLNPDAKGDWSSKEETYQARGILQFHQQTFSDYSKKYNFNGDYLDEYDQIWLAAKMIRDGGINHWKNCNKQIQSLTKH
jgi:hypothetical protein